MSGSKISALPESTTLPNAGILTFLDLTQAADKRNRRITANNLFKMAGNLSVSPTGSITLSTNSTISLTTASSITLSGAASLVLSTAGAITLTGATNEDLTFTLHESGVATFNTDLGTGLLALGDTTSKILHTAISIVDADVLRVGEFGINAVRSYDDDLKGFGVPHRGTLASTECPATCTFFESDVYPATQFIAWGHDNIEFLWDAYTDDHSTYKSSAYASNMRFTKSSAILTLQTKTGVIEGNTITWNNVISIASSTRAITFATQAILGNLILISTVPGTNPDTGKQYLYVNASGQLEARGASGTITILAAA